MKEMSVCNLIEKQLIRPEIVWLFGAYQTGKSTIKNTFVIISGF